MHRRTLGQLCLALAAGVWGGMYVVSKAVLAFIPPLELVWLRYLVALVTLAAIGLVSGRSWRIRWKDVPLVAAIGAVGYFLSIWAQFAGTRLSSAQMGAVITSATPAFMVLFARLLLKERITARKALSVGLATAGVLLIAGLGGLGASFRLGGLVLGVAALSWALMSVLVKRLPAGYSPLVVTTYAILAAAVLITPFAAGGTALARDGLLSRPLVWGGVLYLGVVSTAGAFWLWNKGLRMVEASTGALYFFLQPLVGTLLGRLLLGEKPGAAFWAGAALILGGVLFVVREPAGAGRRAPSPPGASPKQR